MKGEKEKMPVVTPVELTKVKTGEVHSFETMGLADDFLRQCHGYIYKHLLGGLPITNRHGTEFTAKLLPKKHIKQQATETYPRQICWDCKKSTGRCSWSQCHKPVKGWTAQYVPERPQNPATYSIIACPEFVEG